MSFELALSVISFALGCGGFVALFSPPGSQMQRRVIMVSTFAVFVVSGAILSWRIWEREQLLDRVSHQIQIQLQSRKTADELVEALFPTDPAIVYEALNRLAVSQQIKGELTDVDDQFRLPHKIRLYSRPD
jgi:hypothetical protein